VPVMPAMPLPLMDIARLLSRAWKIAIPAYGPEVGAKSPAVFGPARENVRTGSPEVDWYFAKHDSRASDETTDLTAAEFADDLDWILDL